MRRPTRIAAAVAATLAAAGLVAVAWARSLFHEPGARRVASLVDTLGARSIVAVLPHPDDDIKACGLLADAGGRPDVRARLLIAAEGDGGIASPAPSPAADAPRWLVYVLAPRGAARVFGGARGRRVAADSRTTSRTIARAPAPLSPAAGRTAASGDRRGDRQGSRSG